MADQKLTHIDEKGDVRMVDVSEKDDTKRVAVAEGFIAMHAETLEMITSGSAAKGDVLACARVAGSGMMHGGTARGPDGMGIGTTRRPAKEGVEDGAADGEAP